MSLSELLATERQRDSTNQTAVQEQFKEPLTWAKRLVEDLNAEGYKAELIINPTAYPPAVFEVREFTIPVATIVIGDEEHIDEQRVDIYGPSHSPRYALLEEAHDLSRVDATSLTEQIRTEVRILAHEVRLNMRKFHSRDEVEKTLMHQIRDDEFIEKTRGLKDVQTVREIALDPNNGNPPVNVNVPTQAPVQA